jgi:hypothetical protein
MFDKQALRHKQPCQTILETAIRAIFSEAWECNPNFVANGLASAIGIEHADYEPVMQEAKNTPDSIRLLVEN